MLGVGWGRSSEPVTVLKPSPDAGRRVTSVKVLKGRGPWLDGGCCPAVF